MAFIAASAAPAHATDLDVDGGQFGNSPYFVTTSQSWGNVRVGISVGGLIQHSSGLLDAGGDVILGAGATGNYTLSGGTLNASRIFAGTGISSGGMSQTGGTVTSHYLEVGRAGAANGSYGIGAGTFTVDSGAVNGNGTGSAKLSISGGSGTVVGDLSLGNAAVSVSGTGQLSVGSISMVTAGLLTIVDPNASTSALTIGGNNASSSLTATVQNGASPGGITKVGSGTLTIARVQPFTGPTRVLGGTLTLDNTSNLSTIINPASAITVTGGTLHLQGAEFNVIFPATLTVGAGGKVEAGNSTHNAHTLTAVTMQGGELANTTAADPIYGNFVLNGTLTASGGVVSTISAAVFQLLGVRTFDVAANSELTVSKQLTNTNNNTQVGGLTKTGPGTLTLASTGATTYTGGTTVSAGTLKNNGALAGTVSVSGTAAGTGTYSGAVTINSGGTLAPGNAGVGTLNANTLTLAAGSKLTYEFKTGGNDFVNVTGTNGLAINGGAITLYAEGTTNPASISGAIDVMAYVGTLSGSVANLSVVNPVAGITYTFSNDTARKRVVLTITGTTAPAITSGSSATFQTGVAGSFTVTTTGYPFATITRTGNALPSGVTLTSNGDGTATLAGTPATGTGGVYTFTINAQNSAGSATPQTFTLTVNQPAAITSANAATFLVGTAGSFTVTKSGFPAPTVTITGGTLPGGLTFASDTLSGTPAAGTGGTRSLTFTATNGVGTAPTQSFTLTVNQAPAITSANATTFQTGAAGTFTVTASGFPVPAITQTGTLPSGVTFTGGNGTATLAGTPGAATGGTYTLTFNGQSTAGSAPPQTFTLTVNQPAAITSGGPPPNSGVVGTVYTGYTFAASGFPAPTFSVSAGSLPPGLTLTTAGVLSGTPTTSGTFSGIKVRATNSTGAPDTAAFAITISPRLYDSQTTVTTSGSPSVQGDPVTFTATVVPNETGAPSTVSGGTVQFLDGATVLSGAVALNASGQAAYTTGALTAAGSPHTIKAQYSGDPAAFRSSFGTVTQAIDACASNRVVTSLADSGAGTLRQALASVCSGGTVIFALPAGPQVISLTSGELVLDRNVTITGPGATQLTVNRAAGAGAFRIFRSAPGVTATVSGLTVAGGNSGAADGGGILSDRSNLTLSQCVITGNGTSQNGGGVANISTVGGAANESRLTVQNCVVSGNTATSSFNRGGGIVSRADNGGTATLIITGSAIEGNTAQNGGGGGVAFYSANGSTSTAQIASSTISGNSCGSTSGGGIYAQAATLSLANSTVHGNTAGFKGGGVYLSGIGALPHTISNSTITANGNLYGGGIWIESDATLQLNNSIVASNTGYSGTEDIVGFTLSGSYNLIGIAEGSNYQFTSGAENLSGVDAQLEKDGNGIPLLKNNGGPTKTVLLLPDSPANDHGKNSALDGSSNPILLDQRGLPRPVRYDPAITLPNGGDGSDIGAVELATVPRIAVEQPAGTSLQDAVSTVFFGLVPTGSNSSRTFTVRNAGVLDLLLGAITITGPDAAQFVAGAPGATTLTPGATTTFTVTFTPTGSAPRTAVLHIASNAPGAASSFDININGGIRSTNADLSALALSQGTLTPAFNYNTTAYSAAVPATTTSITVTPTAADVNATGITVNGTAVASGIASAPINLGVGQNTITITVTAEDGTTTRSYTVTVDRQRYASATAVSSSRNPSAAGAAITFTATVTPNGAGAPPLASGTVQFFDGATPLVSSTNGNSVQTLDGNGRATCTTSALSVNGSPHTIQAQYSGDGNFGTSAGAVSQVITVCAVNATVTSTADDGSPGTLRDVIAQVCPGAVVQFNLGPGAHTIDLINGEIALNKNVTVLGPGAIQLTVRRSLASGTPSFRIFNIAPGVTAAISGLTIANGAVLQSQSGGGLLVTVGDLTLSDCVVTGNTATGSGGGIQSSSSVVTVTNCVLSGNTAQYGGAAIGNDTSSSTATLRLSNSTLSGNMNAQDGGGAIRNSCIQGLAAVQIANCTFTGNSTGQFGNGGAIYNITQDSGTASVQVDNSTLSGNAAGAFGGGGAIYNYAFGSGHATMLVNNSTVAGNTGGGQSGNGGGGGIYNFNRVDNNGGGTPTVTLQSSIVANNIAQPGRGPDIFNSNGEVNASYSLVRDTNGFTFTNTVGNLTGVDPLLGPLGNNGGPTLTCALLTGSPAIDAGDPASTLRRDQRGYKRVGRIDMGAFEANGVAFRINSVARSSNDMVISFDAIDGETYRLQRNPDLALASPSSVWAVIPGVSDITASGTGPRQFTDPGGATLGKAFYRIQVIGP